MIAKEKEAEILRLYHGEKWPVGTIAGQLGLHHTTVQRVLGQAGVDPKVVAPRPSMVDPFVPFIVEQLGKYPSLRSSRLFVMLKERGYPGGPDHLRRVICRLRPKKPAEAFQRLRTLPGEQAQVDWAHFGKLAIGRARRPLWAFVMVLSQQIEQPEHIQRLVDEKRRAREHRGLDRLARAARSSQAFLRVIAERGGNVGSAIARLLQMLDAVGAAELEEALVEVLERDTIHVGAVRQVIDRRRSERCLPPPVSIPVTRGQHANVVVTPHSLATYDALKKDSTP